MNTQTKKRIVWVRHTSTDVQPGTCYGQTDVPLKTSFEEEALECIKHLNKYSFEKAYTSPLSRCMKLARFCGFEKAVIDERLMEMNFGDWEMQRYDEIEDPYLQEWFNDYIHLPAPNGESFEMQYARKRGSSILPRWKYCMCTDLCRPCNIREWFQQTTVLWRNSRT